MDAWADKEATIKKVIELACEEAGEGDNEDLCRFIEGFFGQSAPDDIVGTPEQTLFGIAASMWRLAEVRGPGKPKIKVFNTTPKRDGWSTRNTVVQILNDDMPFLVDSITGGLTVARGLGIHVLHHPLFFVERDANGNRIRTTGRVDVDEGGTRQKDRESCIYIEIDAQPDSAKRRAIKEALGDILRDVKMAVDDWQAMTDKVDEAMDSLADYPAPVEDEVNQETIEFLNWLKKDHFTLIGYREYRFNGDPKTADFLAVRKSGLGILQNPATKILRGAKGLTAISDEIRDFLGQPDPIIITKANVKTRVHRPVHLDYIGIKIFDEAGRVLGERRFVGLFTSQSYGHPTNEVPLLRRKVRNVGRRALFGPDTHAGKALTHILEGFPRDELFQISENQLLKTALGILHLRERPRVRAFIRCDKFQRFISALVYVPRDKYNSQLRLKIEKVLCDSFNGQVSVYYAELTETHLARWHFIIRTEPGRVPDIDEDEIEARIAEATKDWTERLQEKLAVKYEALESSALIEKYSGVFSMAYQEAFAPHQAVLDIGKLEELHDEDQVCFDIYHLVNDPPNAIRLKMYNASAVVPLSDCLPMLEHLGLRVIGEHSYELLDERGGCIQDFYLESALPGDIDPVAAKPLLEQLLIQVSMGRLEDDGLNALAIQAQIPWQEIVILRAYVRYLRQIGLPFSQDYVEECVVNNPEIARNLISIFQIKFDPKQSNIRKDGKTLAALEANTRSALDKVASLDEDRTLRSCLKAIRATVRTNYYIRPSVLGGGEAGQLGLAVKIQTRTLEIAPRPRPFAEIFVYSHRYEGIHLRGGPVARGGLRWSDRPEDFRTEVLGLVKAQQVKNAVIVPVGAKGGFVPKHLPDMQDRKAFMAEGIACYKSFVSSLLSVTDNLKNGRTVPPRKVVRWDKADPYLVVAADKGTATFSDIANDIAIAHGFWLGDAFASGGSNGYDHKKMGITARGGWVSVERHFREMGINVAVDPITVIGIGDMSGDVFGNGVLLSKALKLKAAFDHRDIFFDPDPDPETSHRERRRLFRLPRSSWQSYNSELISSGGGIYSRSAKSIKLTKEFQAFLGVDAGELSPLEIIHLMLKAEADLLWVGGIGTYVKGSAETNAQVGDRSNDALRINASQLRVKVLGEGGNLGLTQKARIEFARGGGRLNTDFIDNSAGVDCSDKEVNIKILLQSAIQSGSLEPAKRNKLLSQMTREVSAIVLQDNYLQTQAISIAERAAVQERAQHLGLIRLLEREGRLDREIEDLPSDEDFSALALAQEGLTRPEISVLISYGKMSLFDALMKTDLIDNPVLDDELEWGFPTVLRKRFAAELRAHQLRREIVATTLANEVINRGGLTYVFDVREEIGLPVEQIVSAFLIVRDAFCLDEIWDAIDALDYKVPSRLQTDMHMEIRNFLHHQTTWFLRNLPKPLDVANLIGRYRKGLEKLLNKPEGVLSPLELEDFKAKCSAYRSKDVPDGLARKVSAISVMSAASDIVNVAESLDRKVQDVARAYFEVGNVVGFDWLRSTALTVMPDDHWDFLAIGSVVDDLADQQRELTRLILSAAKGKGGLTAVAKWRKAESATVFRTGRLLDDLRASGAVTVAKLSYAARQCRSMLPLA